MVLQDLIEREAADANLATASLRDDLVAEALRGAAALVRERRRALLEANAADVAAAAGRLDKGTLDRLRLDDARVEGLARQVEAMAEIQPLEREAGSWTLPNGLRVSEPSGHWLAEAKPELVRRELPAIPVEARAARLPREDRFEHRQSGARGDDRGARRRRPSRPRAPCSASRRGPGATPRPRPPPLRPTPLLRGQLRGRRRRRARRAGWGCVREGIAGAAAAEVAGRSRGPEAVHRDRLVVY